MTVLYSGERELHTHRTEPHDSSVAITSSLFSCIVSASNTPLYPLLVQVESSPRNTKNLETKISSTVTEESTGSAIRGYRQSSRKALGESKSATTQVAMANLNRMASAVAKIKAMVPETFQPWALSYMFNSQVK